MLRTLIIGLLSAFIVGCSSYGSLRDENRINISKIDRGMTKAQVSQIMGDGEKSGSGLQGGVTNPYKREFVRDRNGKDYEILYYYTEQIGNKDWESGMTPVILVDNKVVGIGWRYLDSSDLNVTLRNR